MRDPLSALSALGQAAASPPAKHIEFSTESDPDPDSADHSMWSAGGSRGAWVAVISFGGDFSFSARFRELFLSGREALGRSNFVWRCSVGIRRGDRGRLDPAGLTKASARLRVMRMRRNSRSEAMVAGFCGVGDVASRLASLPAASPPSGRPARKSHCSDLPCRWRCHEVTVGSFCYLVRARREPPSACGISPRGAGGEGKWGQSAGLLEGGGEGGAVGGERGVSPLCLRHLPRQETCA